MARSKAVLAVAFILFTGLAACDTAEERAEGHLQNALALIAEGDSARARVEFQNVFKLDANHRDARMAFASMLEADGELPAAYRNFLVVVEQFPEDPEALLRISQIAVGLNQWEPAERYGRRLAEVDPDSTATRMVTLNLDYRQAVQNGETTLRDDLGAEAFALDQEFPDQTMLHRILLDWHMDQGRPRDGLAQVDRAIEDAPRDLSLYQARLGILNQLGETPMVAEQLREMVKLFPDNTRVQRTLFTWLMGQGDIDAAEDFLRDLANNPVEGATPEEINSQNVALVRFLRANRGEDAAIAELDRLVTETNEADAYRALRAGIVFDQGDRDAAIAEMTAITDSDEPTPQIRDFKTMLARMLLANGNSVGARQLIEEVLSEDRSHVAAAKLKAPFLIDGDKAGEAVVLLRGALKAAPDDHEIYTLLASAHERNGDRELIGDVLARAMETSDRAPAQTMRLAAHLAGRGNFGPAEQALIEGLRRTPNHIGILRQLGGLYVGEDKLGEANNIESALRAIGSPEADDVANGLQLAILQSQNRSDDFVAMIEQMSQGQSQKSQATVAIMRTHIANGKIERARETINEAVAADPENLDLQFALSIFQSVDGDPELSRQTKRAILEREPRAENVWLSLARSHASQGDAQAAEAVIDEALVQLPGAPNSLWAKAGYLEQRGDIAGAIEIYEGLYDNQSSSLVAANNLASLLSSYQQSPEVIERAYTIARRLRDIPQPAFQDTYGWIAFLRGDLEGALAHLEPAAVGLPGDALVQYHLARTYQALDRPADAAEVYERAITVLGDRTNEAMQDVNDRFAAMKAAAEADGN